MQFNDDYKLYLRTNGEFEECSDTIELEALCDTVQIFDFKIVALKRIKELGVTVIAPGKVDINMGRAPGAFLPSSMWKWSLASDDELFMTVALSDWGPGSYDMDLVLSYLVVTST